MSVSTGRIRLLPSVFSDRSLTVAYRDFPTYLHLEFEVRHGRSNTFADVYGRPTSQTAESYARFRTKMEQTGDEPWVLHRAFTAPACAT